MLDHPVSFAEDVVYVDEFRVACICHAMVADKYDVYDIGQVPCCERVVDIPCESIDLAENSLIGEEKEDPLSFLADSISWLGCGSEVKRTFTSGEFGPLKCPAWSSEGSYAMIPQVNFGFNISSKRSHL